VKEKCPSLVFLMEMKLQSHCLETMKVWLGFQSVFVIDCMGQSGGLTLFWSIDLTIEIQNYSRQHINAIVKAEENGQPWKFIGFYGHPEVGHQTESWNLLIHVLSYDPVPWLCLGDFNETLKDVKNGEEAAKLDGRWIFSERPLSHVD
jgi:hypothetical protein